MRSIVKGAEPRNLTGHRLTSHSSYDNYPDKEGLRVALVTEQRGLCCYCMGRISPEPKRMKIEHWRCVAKYPLEQLDYKNLLGSCMGREGRGIKLQHCDTRKADRDLRWNPADPDHCVELRIEYSADGAIRSTDKDFDKQLNEDLNLNIWFIKNGRKGVLDSIGGWWRSLGVGDRTVFRRRLEKKILKLTEAPLMDAYDPVAIWWLKKRLARMAS